MKPTKVTLATLAFFTAILALPGALSAQTLIPQGMNYQGFLTDVDGNIVGAGTVVDKTLQFRVYKASSGGSPIWAEEQEVSVLDGNFSVILGNGVSLDANIPSGGQDLEDIFNNSSDNKFFLGISADGAEFSPRQQILPTAFSMRSKVAEHALSADTATVANSAGVADRVNQSSGNSTLGNVNVNGTTTLNSSTRITSSNRLELGYGIGGKHNWAGVISYNAALTDSLEIFGAGTSQLNRKISLYSEGGLRIVGSTDITGGLEVDGLGDFNGQLDVADDLVARGGIDIRSDDLTFTPPRSGQHINLHSSNYGIGIQTRTMYFRSDYGYAWYKDGSHNGSQENPGGGTTLATLDNRGVLEVLKAVETEDLIADNGVTVDDFVIADRVQYRESVHSTAGPWTVQNENGLLLFYYQGAPRGFVTLGGQFVPYSDETMKRDIEGWTHDSEAFSKLRPVTYNAFDAPEGEPRSHGFLAQEVREIYPDMVVPMPNGKLGLKITDFLPITVAAVQAQEERIEELEQEVDDLKSRLSAIEEMLRQQN